MAPNRLNYKKVEEAIEGTGGIQTIVANRCQVSRQALNQFLKKYPKLLQKLEEERDSIVDLAEAKLRTRLNEGSDFLIWKTLSTKGKSRGYGEKTELGVTGNLRLVIRERVHGQGDNDRPIKQTSAGSRSS